MRLRLRCFRPPHLSFRIKAVLGIVLVEALLLGILVFGVMHHLRESNEKQLLRHARLTAGNFASLTRDALAEGDAARLQALAEQLSGSEGIVYARILDASQRVVAAAGQAAALQRPFAGERPGGGSDDIRDGVFDIAAPVEVAGRGVGSVRIGLDSASLARTFDDAERWSIAIAALETLLVVACALLLGSYLTRHLARFTRAAENIGAGQLGQQLEVIGQDEIARATVAFNTMSRAIQRERETLEARVRERTEALSRERDMAQRYLDIAGVMLLGLDPDGRITMINRKGAQIIGLPEERLIGQDWFEICTPAEHRLSARAHFGRLIKRQAAALKDYEKHIVNATGEMVIVCWNQALLFDAAGECCGMLLSGEDITERRVAQQRLETSNATLVVEKEKAESASRAKSAFLANISHEIRTPLNAILGTAQMLELGTLNDAQRQQLRTIRNAGRSLLSVINDVLDFSKIEAGRFELESAPFVLRNLMTNLIDVLSASAAAKGLALTLAPLPEGAGVFLGDAPRLAQVLYNLTGNAIKFTSVGSVTVSVDIQPSKGGRANARVSVRDTGIGISPDKIALLFNPFVQADTAINRQFGGTGLGLAISRHLVTLMGGDIGVESRLHQGSEFWFQVPLTVVEAAPSGIPAVAAAGRAASVRRLEGLRVLVVDDSRTNQDVVRQFLELEGAQVSLADDGKQAVDRLREAPDDYDLVLMDVQMPGLDGLAATRLIRDEQGRGDLPIVAITAGISHRQRESAQEAGFDEFVSKPFELETIVSVILRLAGDKLRPPAPAVIPAATLASPDNFPDVPGIDRRQAEQRLLGDKALFFRLLRALRDEFSDTTADVRADLARGDAASAAGRLHKLRSSAGNLSAERVAMLAGALEDVLGTATPEAVNDALSLLAEALAELVAGLPAELDAPDTPVRAGGDAPSDIALHQVAQLIAELAEQSMNAFALFDDLRPGLAAWHGGPAVAELAEAIDNLAFGAAEARLRAWYPQL